MAQSQSGPELPLASEEAELLRWIERELAETSTALHALTRRWTVLLDQATRLRLGAPAAAVRVALQEVEPDVQPARPKPAPVKRLAS